MWVTGASRGLGHAIPDAGVLVLAGSVSADDDERAPSAIDEAWGGLDVLVNAPE